MMSPNIFKNEVDSNLIKHMVLTSILNYKKTYTKDYGDLVICCDGRSSWRKHVFKHYKANRKKDKDSGFLDWDAIYEVIGEIKDALRDYFPYKLVEVETAEADDVIAVLSSVTPHKKHLIISSDKDFGQLQSNVVDQFCPKTKSFIKHGNPKMKLFELIVRGDLSDGIPNIRSDADSYVIKKRCKPITQKFLDECKNKSIIQANQELTSNFTRNRQLIDFACIPQDVKNEIIDEFQKPIVGNKRKTMEYLAANSMRTLLPEAGNF